MPLPQLLHTLSNHQLHIDQHHTEEPTPKAEEDFFADCENEQLESNSGLNSGALFAKEEAPKVSKVRRVLFVLIE